MIKIVPQNHAVIIKRFGKYARTIRGGLGIKMPFFETIHYVNDWGEIANKNGFEIELNEQQLDTGPRSVVTKDNVQVDADAVIYWRIIDPVKAVFDVDVLPKSLKETALTALRSEIGKIELDRLFESRQRLSDPITASISEIASRWGVQIDRVEIQELDLGDAAQMMRQEAEAERKRRARVAQAAGEAEEITRKAQAEADATRLRATAEREAAILEADGKAKATKLAAEAEREYLHALTEVIGKEAAARLLIAEKTIQGFAEMSQGNSNKVFIPNNFRGMMLEGEVGG